MKKNFNILFVVLICSTLANSQQLYFEAGKSLTSFKYLNSQGATLDNLYPTTNSMMAIGYREPAFGKKTNGNFGLSYAGYGAIGSADNLRNFMEWELNYLEFNLGLDCDLFKLGKLQLYAKMGSSFSFLIQGTQRINNQIINAKKTKDFNKAVVNLSGGFGFLYPVNRTLSLYSHYDYSKSLTMKSSSKEHLGQERLNLISNGVVFGLMMNIL